MCLEISTFIKCWNIYSQDLNVRLQDHSNHFENASSSNVNLHELLNHAPWLQDDPYGDKKDCSEMIQVEHIA